MKCFKGISLAVLLPALFLLSCSNTRFLADDELLYTGRTKIEIIEKEGGISIPDVNSTMRSTSSHKVNNGLLGKRVLPPVGLWVHNYWDVNDEKKFASWLHNSMAAPPVLISDVKPGPRADKIESELFDRGYFRNHAWSVVDTSSRNPKKATVSYFLEVERPYRYRQVELQSGGGPISSLFRIEEFSKELKAGNIFNLNTLRSVQRGLSRQIQEEGYFYFTPDYVDLQADTALGTKQLDLQIGSKANIPPAALKKYHIGQIDIFIAGATDTSSTFPAPLLFDGLRIHSKGYYIKPQVLRNVIFLHEGVLYSYSSHRNTVARLNNLGIFSYVNMSYNVSESDSINGLLDVRIDLRMAQNINLDFAADLVMKSTGFMGPGVGVGVSHGNSFKGAERIHLEVVGSFEWQWGAREEYELGSFSYEFGINNGLSYPRLLIPGMKSRILSINNQQTSINFSAKILNRTAYYTMLSGMANLNYSWGKRREVLHSFSPLYLHSVNLLATTAEFDSIVDENIYIRKSFEEQFILGAKYSITFDNTFKTQPTNYYFQLGIGTSGTLADLIIGSGKEEADRPYMLLGNVYSQYVKFTSDLRYYINFRNKALAIRMYAGIGLPYLNSDVLPYVEQFFSGGAYSIRGFMARALGPGTFYDQGNHYIDQSGDLKLEANLEYRFTLSRIVKGALFVDAGNIWLVNEDENRPGSGFEFRNFYQELAIGTGVGLRFDFTFFVLRTDVGFPLRTPYLKDDTNWQIGTGNFLTGGMFYLAIGYPF